MATDWEGSPRTESRMFALGFETKQKKWCRETCRVCIWPSTHPSTELSCRASHQSCHSRLMVGSPGPTAWAGQGLSPQPHQPHRGCQHGLDGMWHCLPTLSPARSSLGPAHTCTSATAPLRQLQLLGLLPWLDESQHSLFYPTEEISKHHTAPQTRHNYLVTDTHNCDGAAIVWVSWAPHARRKGGIKHSSFLKIPEKKNNGSILHFTFHCMNSISSWSYTLLQRDAQHLPRHQCSYSIFLGCSQAWVCVCDYGQNYFSPEIPPRLSLWWIIS